MGLGGDSEEVVACLFVDPEQRHHHTPMRIGTGRVPILSVIDSSRMTHVSGFVESLCMGYAPTTLLDHEQARIKLLCCNSASQSQGKETGYCPV